MGFAAAEAVDQQHSLTVFAQGLVDLAPRGMGIMNMPSFMGFLWRWMGGWHRPVRSSAPRPAGTGRCRTAVVRWRCGRSVLPRPGRGRGHPPAGRRPCGTRCWPRSPPAPAARAGPCCSRRSQICRGSADQHQPRVCLQPEAERRVQCWARKSSTWRLKPSGFSRGRMCGPASAA